MPSLVVHLKLYRLLCTICRLYTPGSNHAHALVANALIKRGECVMVYGGCFWLDAELTKHDGPEQVSNAVDRLPLLNEQPMHEQPVEELSQLM